MTLRPIVIRPYRPEDRQALVMLWSEVFPNDPPRNAPDAMISNKQRVQPELLLVAVHEVRLIGAVMAGFDGTRGWIHHLAVHPAHRLRGVGSELVRAAETGLRNLGCPKVNLQIRGGNSGVVAFYQALGYAVEDRVSMGKVLGTPASTSDVTLRPKVSPGAIDMRIDHVQLAMPEGGEVEARRFFGGLLGLEETPKPESLRSTGGCWFLGEGCELHLGVDPDFRPQRKAHPGFAVAQLRSLAGTLEAAGFPVVWDDRIADVERFYTDDPFGNRLEFRGESGP